jgi:hypothetical protein
MHECLCLIPQLHTKPWSQCLVYLRAEELVVAAKCPPCAQTGGGSGTDTQMCLQHQQQCSLNYSLLVSLPKGMCYNSTLLHFGFQRNPTCQSRSQLDYQSAHLQLPQPTFCRS